MDPLKYRLAVERRVVRRFLKDAFAAGYVVEVDDGGESLIPCPSVAVAMDSIFAVDEARVYVQKGAVIGWVFFVFGNDGWDSICDHTVNLSELLAGAEAVAALYEPK